MRATQIIGACSLISLVVAAAIVLAGQQQQVQTLLAPGSAGNTDRSKAAADSVVGSGEIGKANSELGTLIHETIYNTIGSTTVSDAASLQKTIVASEPEIPLGKPLKQGGVDMEAVDGGTVVVFCATPNYYTVCAAIDLSTRAQGGGQNHSLSAARDQAIADTGAKAPGGAQPQSSGQGQGGAQAPNTGPFAKGTATGDAIQKLRQLQKNGVP